MMTRTRASMVSSHQAALGSEQSMPISPLHIFVTTFSSCTAAHIDGVIGTLALLYNQLHLGEFTSARNVRCYLDIFAKQRSQVAIHVDRRGALNAPKKIDRALLFSFSILSCRSMLISLEPCNIFWFRVIFYLASRSLIMLSLKETRKKVG